MRFSYQCAPGWKSGLHDFNVEVRYISNQVILAATVESASGELGYSRRKCANEICNCAAPENYPVHCNKSRFFIRFPKKLKLTSPTAQLRFTRTSNEQPFSSGYVVGKKQIS